MQYLTESEKAAELESLPVVKDKSKKQLRDELTGTLVTQTTITEQADTSTTTPTSQTKVKPVPAKPSKHRQVVQDVLIESTISKVIACFCIFTVHKNF